MDRAQPEYLSYLIRLWRVGDGEEPSWRALLKSSQTGHEIGFGNLEALFDYLRREAGLQPVQHGEGADLLRPRVRVFTPRR